METFSALLAICAGNSPVPGGFPSQKPVTRNFDVFFDLRLNKRLSKQQSFLAGDLRRHRAHYNVTVMHGNIRIARVVVNTEEYRFTHQSTHYLELYHNEKEHNNPECLFMKSMYFFLLRNTR